VAVLHDHLPPNPGPEAQDNLVQAETVAQALAGLGLRPALVPFGPDVAETRRALLALAPACVFNLVEAPGGRGETIAQGPALLEELGLAYTGARTGPMAVTSHKLWGKERLASAGLDTPAWRTEAGRGGLTAGRRVILKSVWEHGSLGLDDAAVITPADLAQVDQALAHRRARLGGEWFAEAYIKGREFNLSLLEGEGGLEVLPPAEIVFAGFPADRPRIVGFQAKWAEGSFDYDHTPRRFDFPAGDGHLLDRLAELSRACWGLFGLAGYARVDFRVDASGRPWLLEVNANPCLAPEAGFAAAAAQAGLSLTEVVGRILAAARPGLTRGEHA
jgi:D-alanine-D-alanine ligase